MTNHDVIIIGGGGAGIAAGITAAESLSEGGSILILESAEETGGAAAMSGGGMCLVDTPLQRAHGVEDSVDLAMYDWMAVGGPQADADWALRYLRDGSTDVYGWIEALGLEWEVLKEQEMNSVARWHAPGGSGPALMAAARKTAEERGIHIRTGARVRNLLIENGIASGVSVETPDGIEDIHARAVVVATGGFVNDPQKLKELAGTFSSGIVLCGGAPGAHGDGYDMLAAVGGQFRAIDQLSVYPIGTPNLRIGPSHGVAIRGIIDDIWLNRDGHRFHDERLRGGMTGGRAVLAQPGGTCFAIADAPGMAGIRINGDSYYGLGDVVHTERVQDFLRTSPFVWQADTIGQLAALAGLPVTNVTAAVQHWNADVGAKAELDSTFGWPVDGRAPIAEPPFTCIQYFPIAQKNLGGVRTDEKCGVIGDDGQVIDGLFAAGEVAGMAGGHINGAGALEGTMLGPSLYSGRVAGRAAAEYVRSQLSEAPRHR
jgi:predicted oxidoreductase